MTETAAPSTAALPAARGRPHRVAVLLKNLNPGGVQHVMLTLAGALAARGAEVDLVVCSPEGELRARLPRDVRLVPLEGDRPLPARLALLRADPGGLRAYAGPLMLSTKGARKLIYLRPLAAYLRRERPDALLTGTPFLNIVASVARDAAGVPTRLVVSERTHFSSAKPRKDRRRLRLAPAVRRAYARAEAIVAVSRGVADDLAERTGLPRGRIAVLNNPTIPPDAERRMAAPVDHPWFTEPGPPVILSVGRIGYQKDFPTLLRAFARVHAERPVRLAIIGQASIGAKREELLAPLVQLADDLGIGDAVQFLGYRPDPLPYMARAAVFALSSRFEGLANVLLEALACGTPVVSTDCPSGPFEVLDGGAYGRLVPVGDDAALAAAIQETLNDPPDPARLKARAALFSFDAAVAAYEAVLLGEPPPAAPPPAADVDRGPPRRPHHHQLGNSDVRARTQEART